MSVRSALVNPSQNSGRVGEQLFGVGATNGFTLVTGVQTALDTITLAKGTWLIQIGGQFQLAAATTLLRADLFFAGGGITYVEYTVGAGIVNGVATNINGFTSVVVVLTAATTGITLSGEAAFSGGTCIASKPALTGNHFLTATKLA